MINYKKNRKKKDLDDEDRGDIEFANGGQQSRMSTFCTNTDAGIKDQRSLDVAYHQMGVEMGHPESLANQAVIDEINKRGRRKKKRSKKEKKMVRWLTTVHTRTLRVRTAALSPGPLAG